MRVRGPEGCSVSSDRVTFLIAKYATLKKKKIKNNQRTKFSIFHHLLKEGNSKTVLY